MSLPEPDAIAKQHSQQLQALIAAEIAQQGPLSFARYMELALYAPGLGYYAVGTQKLGEGGDFITAPQISPLFAHTIAEALAPTLSDLTSACFLELGAGSGQFAVDFLKNCTHLPDKYLILEVSPDFRARQQALLKAQCPEHFARVEWLDTLPTTPFNGIIFANEVIDALPIHCFSLNNGQIYERKVANQSENLGFINCPADEKLKLAVAELQIEENDYQSEVNLQLQPWLRSLNDCLQQGLMLFIDYGFCQADYYNPQRRRGTLMCHYRHHAHGDPFFYPGLQDITAHVDFTDVAICAEMVDLEVLAYTNQSGFLIDNGIEQLAQSIDLMTSKALQKLLFPHEMGELFKVIALGKNYQPKQNLVKHDQQYKL